MTRTYPPAAELLPHRGQAVLIDAVLEDTRDSIRVSAQVRADRDFGDDGGLAACACTILCGDETVVRATIIIVEIDEEKLG